MSRIGSIVAFLMVATATSLAQVATIDTRGHKCSMPPVQVSEGAYSSGGDHTHLQLSLTITDPSHLGVGMPFDFELLVANHSNKPVQLPQALDCSDVSDAALRDLRYLSAEISFEVFADDGNLGFPKWRFMMCGSESQPTSLVTVAPGESLNILGTAIFDPQWKQALPEKSGYVMAFLTVSSTVLSLSHEHPNAYRSDARQVWNLGSDRLIPVEFRVSPKQ